MPTVTEKNDKAGLIATQVMARIAQDGLKPTPSVFALLYAHFTGMHPEVTRLIEERDAKKTPLTTEWVEQLHDIHLSAKREKQFLDEAAKKMQATMGEIADLIRGAGVTQKEYNQSLQRQSDTLSSATDLNEIKRVVSTLLDDTLRVVTENQKLENKLQESSFEVQQMRQDMHSLKQESLTDNLTGVPNRKAFDMEMKVRAAEALEKGKPLSLITIDIDHFKVFNDTFGHQVGDQVLRLVARTLAEGLRPSEILSRYGGEEFTVIVPNMKLRDAEKLADKLRERIAAKDIINQSKNEKLGRLSISLGVAQLHPGEPLDNLLDRSDRALYRAKAAGRNTVIGIEYDPKLHDAGSKENIVIDANR